MKKHIAIVLGLIILLSIPFVGESQKPKKQKNYVEIIYFHGEKRCAGCIKIENMSSDAVKQFYSDDLKSGKVLWKEINFDKKENKKYIKQFDLYTQTLVVIKYKNGKLSEWKSLEEVWALTGDKKKYDDYIKKEVDLYLRN